jgi:hypothetical protein
MYTVYVQNKKKYTIATGLDTLPPGCTFETLRKVWENVHGIHHRAKLK